MFSTCNHHYNKRLSHFCPSHDEVICDKCVPDFHDSCRNILTIEKAVDSSKFGTALSNLESRIIHLKTVVRDMLRANTENFTTLNDQRQTIRKKIKEIRKSINAHLDKVEIDLGKELMNKYQVCAQDMEKERQTFMKQKEVLEDWTREIKAMKNHASNVHLFSMSKMLLARQKASENAVQKQLANSKTLNMDFENSRIVHDIKSMIVSYGKITLKETPPFMTSEQRKRMTIPLSLNMKPNSPVISKFETSIFGSNVDLIRGSFLSDDRVIFPDTNSNTLYVCKINGENVKKIKLKYKPKDICVFDKSRAFVTCGDPGILTIDIRTLSPGTFISPGGHCSAISCANDNLFVVNGECKISVMDLKGKVLKSISTRYDPYMLSVSKTGIIYWTNYNNNYVNSILPNGTSQNVYTGSDLRESTGVAVDSRGNVFVAGCESSNIIQVSRADKANKVLYTKKDGILRPMGIALNSDKSKLMVINNYKQVKIYRTRPN